METAKAPDPKKEGASQVGAEPPPGPRHVAKLPEPGTTTAPEPDPPASAGAETPPQKSPASEPEPVKPPVTLEAFEPNEAPLTTPPSTETPTEFKPAESETEDDSAPAPTVGDRYVVQIAAVSNRQNAEKARTRITAKSSQKVDLVDSPNGKLIFVRVGDFADKASAEKIRQELISAGLAEPECFVTKRTN